MPGDKRLYAAHEKVAMVCGGSVVVAARAPPCAPASTRSNVASASVGLATTAERVRPSSAAKATARSKSVEAAWPSAYARTLS